MFKTVLLKRKRECFNGHQSITIEMPISLVAKSRIASMERGTLKRAEAIKTRKLILAHPDLTSTQLGVKLGVSATWIRDIRREARELVNF